MRTMPTKYCWDTSVFIAWIAEEEDKPLAEIGLVVDEISKKRAVLIVPVVVYSEILETRHTQEQRAKFDGLLKRSNVISASTDVSVAQKAAHIRSTADAQGRKIKTPDAQIIATAIIFGADVLHTFDPGLLSLSETSIVDGLRIARPAPIGGVHGLPGM